MSQLHPELEALRHQSQQWASQTRAQASLTQKEAELSKLQTQMSHLQVELHNAHQQLQQQLPSQLSALSHHSSASPQQGRAGSPPALCAESSHPELQQEASWRSAADQHASSAASPVPLAESASVSSAVPSRKHSEVMSDGELKKMAEAFRKSLGLEASSCSSLALDWLCF